MRKNTQAAEAIAQVMGGFAVHIPLPLAPQLLNPAPYNPRDISPFKFDALKRGIAKYGFLENLTIQKRSKAHGPNIIIAGHQRVKAVRELCIELNVPLPQLPCVVLDVEDRDAKMLNIALNNIEGEFIAKLVGEMLEDVNHASVVLPEEKVLMGFEEEDYSRYMKFSEPPRVDGDPERIVGTATMRLEFKSKKARDAVKEKLEERAGTSKKATGDVVMELLLGAGKRRK